MCLNLGEWSGSSKKMFAIKFTQGYDAVPRQFL